MKSKAKIGYWVFTGLFCLQMGFTAIAQLTMTQATSMFPHLGFPDYFRVELGVLKLVGIGVLLMPNAPARLKEWAYCGFAIVLGSALYAHLAVGDTLPMWIWAVGTFALGAGSYAFYHRASVSAWPRPIASPSPLPSAL